VHFITPGQVHLISREEDYHGYLLVFSKDFYSLGAYTPAGVTDFPLFDNHTQVPILNLREQEFETLLGLIGQLKKEYLANEDFSLEILRSYLHIFLLKCRVYHLHYHAEREKLHHPHYEQVRQFKAMVEAQFSKVHLVKDYADQLAVTPVSLNKHVKSITGTTASEFIIDRLVLEAKRLLMYTDLSNKEIAYRMSYDDPSYFSRIFKKKTGLTPTEFKERMHKKYQL
jgi:AraC-like DNA-binding protein